MARLSPAFFPRPKAGKLYAKNTQTGGVGDGKDDESAAYYAVQKIGAMVLTINAILKTEDDNAGRFIPKIGEADHAWAATPLPVQRRCRRT